MTMATLRRWHFYVGMFIAPSVLFFALTGALQLFSLHEAHDSYEPPALIEALAKIHKDQVFKAGRRRGPGPRPGAAAKPAAPSPARPDDDRMTLSTMLLKWFFLVIALGLAASTGVGLWIGLSHPLNRRAGWALVAAGTVIPVALSLV